MPKRVKPPTHIIPQRVTVDSTVLSAVGYSEELRILEVVLRDQALYWYFDVPAVRYRGLLKSKSKGRYYAEHIRGQYASAKLWPVQSLPAAVEGDEHTP